MVHPKEERESMLSVLVVIARYRIDMKGGEYMFWLDFGDKDNMFGRETLK